MIKIVSICAFWQNWFHCQKKNSLKNQKFKNFLSNYVATINSLEKFVSKKVFGFPLQKEHRTSHYIICARLLGVWFKRKFWIHHWNLNFLKIRKKNFSSINLKKLNASISFKKSSSTLMISFLSQQFFSIKQIYVFRVNETCWMDESRWNKNFNIS